MKIPSLGDMLKAGMHFGHQTSRWHPKMQPYIFGKRGGVHIINLEATQRELATALDYVKLVAARGGKILFVGTKRQAQDLVKKYAQQCGMPYVTTRWLGGTLTNFSQIKVTLKRLKTLKDQREKGELRKYTKKEQLLIDREISEIEHKMGGIADLEKTPEALYIVDIRCEKTALAEARAIGIPIVAICDSNVNPADVSYVIPSNDDAIKSLELITSLVAEAVQEGRVEGEKKSV